MSNAVDDLAETTADMTWSPIMGPRPGTPEWDAQQRRIDHEGASRAPEHVVSLTDIEHRRLRDLLRGVAGGTTELVWRTILHKLEAAR